MTVISSKNTKIQDFATVWHIEIWNLVHRYIRPRRSDVRWCRFAGSNVTVKKTFFLLLKQEGPNLVCTCSWTRWL